MARPDLRCPLRPFARIHLVGALKFEIPKDYRLTWLLYPPRPEYHRTNGGVKVSRLFWAVPTGFRVEDFRMVWL